MRSIVLIGGLAALLVSSVAGAPEKFGHAAGSDTQGRYLAVISDLHFGVGRSSPKAWHSTEDFRWPHALEGFLAELSRLGNHAVDLVIAGDFVELWQPPKDVKCKGASADLGCTVEEVERIASIVAREHAQELAMLRAFAARGDNRLYIIPGNHDSTLLIDEVWAKFADPLDEKSGRVQRVRSGVWASADGRVVIEHGHQIGADVNRYADWPEIVRAQDGVRYVTRPWGERFVQRLFNEQEATYSIIDNLSPETAGARYRMADRGVWGTGADMARFLAFNLFETSASQKVAALGPPAGGDESTKWKLDRARAAGHKLFAAAMRRDDPLRAELLADNPQAAALREALDKRVGDPAQTSDAEVWALCDLAAAGTKDGWQLCRPPELGALLQAKLVPISAVLRTHLRERMRDHKGMSVFIYGHTHLMQPRWTLSLTSAISVSVLNTGAFQRLIDEDGFLERIRAKGWSEPDGLRKLTPEDLAPCYGVVIVPYRNGRPDPTTKMWWMGEDASEGKLISAVDKRCG